MEIKQFRDFFLVKHAVPIYPLSPHIMYSPSMDIMYHSGTFAMINELESAHYCYSNQQFTLEFTHWVAHSIGLVKYI